MTDVQARFVDGRVAFIGVERDIGCIFDIEVRERDTDKVVWKVDYNATDPHCVGDDPHFYGEKLGGMKTSVSAGPLRLGTAYYVGGLATGSNYFGGYFRIIHDGQYRIVDLARPQEVIDLTEVDNLIATNSHLQR